MHTRLNKILKKQFIFFTLGAIILFCASGYFLSDDRYFNQIISDNNISSPIDAFNYINLNTSNPDSSDESKQEWDHVMEPYQTPRHILTNRNYIWCDEGAILLATIVHELGYKTRLVDMLDDDGVSRHTALEIYDGKRWILFDTLNDIYGVSYNDSAGYIASPRYRNYPRFYNFLVQNNFFVQQAALTIRGVR